MYKGCNDTTTIRTQIVSSQPGFVKARVFLYPFLRR
nr:MAG TPA: hypothetical protein [Caudoviricetes sp.]